MKKKVIAVLILLCAAALGIFLFYDSQLLKGNEEIIALARKEIPLADMEHKEIIVASGRREGDHELYWLIVGSQGQSQSYYPIEFRVAPGPSEKLIFEHIGTAYDRGPGLRAYPWQGGYSFFIHNEDCAELVIEYGDGTVETVDTRNTFVDSHYIKTTGNFTYTFYDSEGSEIY